MFEWLPSALEDSLTPSNPKSLKTRAISLEADARRPLSFRLPFSVGRFVLRGLAPLQGQPLFPCATRAMLYTMLYG